MKKPFSEIREAHRAAKRPKPIPYMTRLPASVVSFLRRTAKQTGLKQEQIVYSLLLAGIEAWEKEQPLKN